VGYLKLYRQNGWLKVSEVADNRSCEMLRSSADRIIKRKYDGVINEFNGVKQFIWPSFHDDQLKKFWMRRCIHDLVKQFLGCNKVLLLHDQLIVRDACSQGAFSWHQDYWHWDYVDTCNALTIWLPIHAITEEHGPLNISKFDPVESWEHPKTVWNSGKLESHKPEFKIHCDAGDAVVMHSLLTHRREAISANLGSTVFVAHFIPSNARFTVSGTSTSISRKYCLKHQELFFNIFEN